MSYSSEPDYDLIKSYILDVASEKNIVFDGNFEWTDISKLKLTLSNNINTEISKVRQENKSPLSTVKLKDVPLLI